MRRRLAAWWRHIDPPRAHRAFMSARYLCLAVGGVFLAVFGDDHGRDGLVIMGIWLTVGAGLAAIFCLKHRWLIERIALWIVWGAILSIGVGAALSLATAPGSVAQMAASILIIGMAAWILTSLIDRYIEIIRYHVEPGY